MTASARHADSNGSNYYHSAVIKGKTPLKPAEIIVPDIRAGFSYLVAAILAKGETLVHGIHYIDRGYEKIDKKMGKLGVNIRENVNKQVKYTF